MIEELMTIRRNKLPFFQRGLRAMSLMIRTFWRRCHPVNQFLRCWGFIKSSATAIKVSIVFVVVGENLRRKDL